MLTMLLGGLWHGASWQFIIWGGLNGIGLVIYKFWRKISPWEAKNNWAVNIWGEAYLIKMVKPLKEYLRGKMPFPIVQ